jgi:K+-sensing histidine kinase KdpD
LYCNRRICELARIEALKVRRKPAASLRARLLKDCAEAKSIQAAIESALNAGSAEPVEFSLARKPALVLRLHAFKVTDNQGEPIGRGQLIQDITRDSEIDRMKSSLISTVSHELRTPLAAIKGYATTLLADDVVWDPSAQVEFIRVISEESDRLSDLVDNLLDISRIEAGNLQLEMNAYSFPDVVQAALNHSRPKPGERVEIDIDPDLPPLKGDARRTEAVLRNLIENAVKYAGSDATIRIHAQRQNGHVLVRVQDDGPGIKPDEAQLVFEPFVRLGDDLTRQVSGAGLGLTICRGFIQAQGGDIWFEHSQPGAIVAFSLPIQGEEFHA